MTTTDYGHGTWVTITPGHVARETTARSDRYMPQVEGSGGPFRVCNHLVTSGLWMWYRAYDPDVLPGQHDVVNHCATTLWTVKDLGPPWKTVYGTVLFTGDISGAPVSAYHVTRLFVLANLAKSKSAELGLEYSL